jgi:hypothetical protein
VEKRHVIAAGINDPIWQDSPAGPRRHGLRLSGLIALLLVVVACYVVAAAALSRRDYGTFSFWRTPDRINYCGRRYYPAGPVRGTPQSFLSSVAGHPTWRTVGRTFTMRPIDAPVTSRTSAAQVCTMAVYIPTGGRTYIEYDLSGGP